jgi:hypothetical protein
VSNFSEEVLYYWTTWFFFSFWVTEKQSKSVEFLLNTNFILQQKRSKKEGEKIDRSQDIRYVQEFYRRYREEKQVDELEEEVRRDRERQSSDQDTSMYVACSYNYSLSSSQLVLYGENYMGGQKSELFVHEKL